MGILQAQYTFSHEQPQSDYNILSVPSFRCRRHEALAAAKVSICSSTTASVLTHDNFYCEFVDVKALRNLEK